MTDLQKLLKEVNEHGLERTARIEAVPLDEAERKDGADDYRFELSFSSEDAYERWFGIEILGHKQGEVDLEWLKGGSAPLLVQHDRDDIVGVIEKAWIKDRRGKAVVRFGSGVRAKEIRADVLDGIRTNVSVGYRVGKMVLEEQTDDGPDTFRVTSWEPFEVSLVSIPADKTVGVGRAETIIETRNTQMDEKAKAALEEQEKQRRARELEDAKRTAVEEDRQRRQGLIDMGEAHKGKLDGVKAEAERLANTGGSTQDLKDWILKAYSEGKAANLLDTDKAGHLGMDEKEVKRFSFLNAILSQIPGTNIKADFELECSREVAKVMGKEPQGIFVPNDVLTAQRDLQIGGGGTGAYVVATDLQSSAFIDVLRKKTVLQALGATFLTGLVGDIAIPKKSASATAYWVTEGNAPTESQQTLTQVTGTPKTVGAYTDVTRKLLKQGSIDVEMMIRDDIAATLAVAIDNAAFEGTGADGQPSAISAATGANNTTVASAGTPTYAEILNFIGDIATDNADIGVMKWVMTPEVWVKLASTMRVATYGDTAILNPDSTRLLGYEYLMSNNVTANSLWFGVWSQAVLAMWGALDVTVDPYSNSTSGTLRIVGLQDVDVMVRHGQAFSYNTAVTA